MHAHDPSLPPAAFRHYLVRVALWHLGVGELLICHFLYLVNLQALSILHPNVHLLSAHNISDLEEDVLLRKFSRYFQMDGVHGVHEFHLWQLTTNRLILSAHITCDNMQEYMTIASRAKEIFHDEGVHSTTIQPEFDVCILLLYLYISLEILSNFLWLVVLVFLQSSHFVFIKLLHSY